MDPNVTAMSPARTSEAAAEFLRGRLLATAAAALADGRRAGLVASAARAVGCGLHRARRLFPTDGDLVLALYRAVLAEVEPPALGSTAARAAAVLRAKLSAARPWRRALRALTPYAFDRDHPATVTGLRNEPLRARMQAVFAGAAAGRDAPAAGEATVAWARWCHALHLAAMWWWCRGNVAGPVGEQRLVRAFAGVCATLAWLTRCPGAGAWLAPLAERATRPIAPPPDPAATRTAEAILCRLMRHRRLPPGVGGCATAPCPACLAPHLGTVRAAIAAGKPLHLILPAFPAKSPNPLKAGGRRADLAEEMALRHLQAVCDELATLHPPGVRLTICSDGRAFADLVEVGDADVDAYAADIAAGIDRDRLTALDCFRLEDAFSHQGPASLRDRLCAGWARPRAEVAQEIREHPGRRMLFNGIHRFVSEDRAALHPGESRTRAKRVGHDVALEVIRRSDAWSRLLAACFPDALRLSIHPQDPHAGKIGILLGAADDAWLTPWHAVALSDADGIRLVHRAAAERRGARPVSRDGRFSHYRCGPTP